MIGFGQVTMIPDANFEQALINLGYDNGAINGSVYTALIETVTSLNVSSKYISDLTGIEDFASLTTLDCSNNILTTLDLSNNSALIDLNCSSNINSNPFNQGLISLDVSGATALTSLNCSDNHLTSIDVSNNTPLTELRCEDNQLTMLDVSQNTALSDLDCYGNQLSTLDVSANTTLTYLPCYDNQLTTLNVRNGNNINMTTLDSRNNPNLTCINVDDAAWATANWTYIDPQHYFSNNCPPPSAIEEYSTNKQILRSIDVLGRKAQGKKNEPLFYIYDDGTVEKRLTIE